MFQPGVSERVVSSVRVDVGEGDRISRIRENMTDGRVVDGKAKRLTKICMTTVGMEAMQGSADKTIILNSKRKQF